MRIRLNLYAVTALAVLLASCSQNGAIIPEQPAPAQQWHAAAPSLGQLESMLAAEFERLGVDPSRKAAAAPTGAENAVFDLSAALQDSDGAGGSPPSSVTLRWSERLAGDYDQNGQVSSTDLGPIGLFFQQQVVYDNPQAHGGFAAFPSGDPRDTGIVVEGPAAPDSGAANWRLARIDGNGDGRILAPDLGQIGLHYLERLSGYRIYRRLPGETGFTLLPNPNDAGAGETIKRSESAPLHNSRPVLYAFSDDLSGLSLGDGVVSYYVAAYDEQSGTEAAAGNQVDMAVGSEQGGAAPSPQIEASENPVFVDAVVSFDASASSDDGSIVDYKWDLDGDGSFETGTGAGSVIEHVYSGTGLVTVRVQVTDDGGLTATAQLLLRVRPLGITLSGVAVDDATGLPLPGVTVTLDGGSEFITGADGSFYFDGLDGGAHYVVGAYKPGFAFEPSEMGFDIADEDSGGAMFRAQAISATHTISGHTLLLLQKAVPGTALVTEPVEGATVTCFELDGETFVSSAVSDSEGFYEFDDIPEGTFILEVTTPAVGVDGWVPFQRFIAMPQDNGRTECEFIDTNNMID